jgi:transcriptional regulator with XRE-family HTH domain
MDEVKGLEVAARLRAAVRRRGSQAELVRRLAEVGVETSEPNVAHWLSGRHSPSLVQFRAICEALNVGADAILGLPSPPSRDGEEVVFVPLAMTGQAVAEPFKMGEVGATSWTTLSVDMLDNMGIAGRPSAGQWVISPAADLEGEAMGWSVRTMVLVDREPEAVAEGEVHVVWDAEGGRWVVRRVFVEGSTLLCQAAEPGYRPFSLSISAEPTGRVLGGRVLVVIWPQG